MSLTPGTRLGPYEILSPLGAGGMGEVYHARDTKLGRDVAIKVLPDELFEDKERVARFEREARALASLNHPAIAVIHAFEEISGRHLLVQEFLEGETLRERLRAGALPARKALDIAAQIARGLAAAHEKGVVHRDLKPENLFVTKDGHVKILDFGLARQIALPTDASDTTSPTLARPTEQGVILGTVAYMSPEQVRGLPVDHRADIFAFGCVLYEMVSGRRPFAGQSAVETMHAILRDEAPELPAGVRESAPGCARLIATCLAKDPRERWQSAADLARELSWLGEDQRRSGAAPAASRRHPARWLPWAMAVLGAAIAVIAVLASKGLTRLPEHVIRFSMLPPEKTRFERNAAGVTLASSPDGRSIALLGSSGGRTAVWLWSVAEGAATRLADTDGAASLFWSPDGLSVGFFAEGKLKKVAVSGGPAQVLCEALGNAGTWSTNGVILFSEIIGGEREGIYRVSAEGGKPAKLTLADGASADATRVWPVFLPDGTHFLYVRGAFRGAIEDYRVCVGQLESPEATCLMQSDSRVEYAPPGRLLFVRKGTLLTQPFDAGERRVSGQPAPIADRIAAVGPTGSADFATSADGRLLVYRHGVPPSRLVWMDRSGRQVGSIGEPGYFGLVRISPDGGRLVTEVEKPATGGRDLWLYDLSTGIGSRLTFDPVSAGWPVWSPDGGRVAFGSGRRGPPDIYVKDLGGPLAEKLLFGAPGLQAPSDWTRDGRFIAYVDYSPIRKAHSQIWLLPMTGEPKPVRLDESPFSEYKPRFSPDSRFIAFVSEESGQPEVYVAAVDGAGRKQRVSPAGGSLPCWSADGKELFFQAGDNVLMTVAVRLGQDIQFSVPKPLFSLPPFPPFPLAADYDVSHDGQRFLINLGTERASQPPLIVTLGWQQRLAGDRPEK
jgi:eukaryotic-like serine/threonine-protein kinase